jgi:hypothetical protein
MDLDAFGVFVVEINIVTDEDVAADAHPAHAMQPRAQRSGARTDSRQAAQYAVQTPSE